MKQSSARIRSFTLKSNGKRVDVITPAAVSTENRLLVEDARVLSGPDLHGYFIMTWDCDGFVGTAFSWKDQTAITALALPGMAAEAARRTLRNNGYLD